MYKCRIERKPCLKILLLQKKKKRNKNIVFQVLQLFVTKCGHVVEDKLGEILGYLAVLIGLHKQVDGLSLVPTNLPHLQFNQV